MNSHDVKVVVQSSWKPAEAGMAKCRVVIWEQSAFPPGTTEARFATHVEYDQQDGRPPYFHQGHYDMNRPAALRDFRARCRQNGIRPVEAGSI